MSDLIKLWLTYIVHVHVYEFKIKSKGSLLFPHMCMHRFGERNHTLKRHETEKYKIIESYLQYRIKEFLNRLVRAKGGRSNKRERGKREHCGRNKHRIE